MNMETNWLNEAFKGTVPNDFQGRVGWQSPSNIALVKYWGKSIRKYAGGISGRMKDTQVLLYTSYLHQIGGIETFVLNFIEHLHDHYDITLMSERIPDDMAVRIAKLCRVIDRAELGEIQAAGFSCDVLVMIRLTDEIPSFVTYDKSIRMCHASKILCKKTKKHHIS